MTTVTPGPQRLYLMRIATMIYGDFKAPIPCYLIQTGDGKNILVDSGLPLNFQRPAGLAAQSEQIELGKNVIEQLASIGVQPADIDMLISTHYDLDHAGNNDAFPNAQLIVQREQHEVASGGDPRFELLRSQWDLPASRYQLLDGDTELLPGLELIETSGHVPGHQSVFVQLPNTGLVLLAADAVTVQEFYRPDRPGSPWDLDADRAIVSTRKLIDLAEKKHASLVIFGHDDPQWSTLKLQPEYYD
jgi:N-acyl homoserine lactone hydrolase